MKIYWTTAPPPDDMWGELTAVGSVLPPLGLCYLAAISRQAGWETRLLDCYAESLSLQSAVQKIKDWQPDIVGISATTQEILQAAALAGNLKQKYPGMTIILGGVHVTSLPIETLTRYPQFDLAFIGESEATLPEFLEAIQKESSLEAIPGLVVRPRRLAISHSATNKSTIDSQPGLLVTERRTAIKDMDALPLPAFDLLPELKKHYRPAITNYKRLPAIGIVTSRGCPGKCAFCDRTVFGNRLRILSTDRILEIVTLLCHTYGIREINFYDDTLVAHRTRLRELCRRLIVENLDLTWSCNARVDMVNPELLQLMRRAGCWQISFGIETGDQHLLDQLKKGITLEQVEKAVQWSKEAGLYVKGYYMIGLPGESTSTLKKTETQMLHLRLDDILLEFFTPFPGTELYDRLKNGNDQLKDWEKLNTFELSYIPKGMNRQILTLAYKRMLTRFYLRPRIIANYIKRFANPLQMLHLAKTFITFIKSP